LKSIWKNQQKKTKKMNKRICPTCGCSLIRLGISDNDASTYPYQEQQYLFCCNGCVDLFKEDPEKFIKEIEDVVVCPVCLAEKSVTQAVSQKHRGEDVFFCRCTHCQEEFAKNPDYYLERLEGKVDHQGMFGNSCCQI
jgi:YHS domain-containing protein